VDKVSKRNRVQIVYEEGGPPRNSYKRPEKCGGGGRNLEGPAKTTLMLAAKKRKKIGPLSVPHGKTLYTGEQKEAKKERSKRRTGGTAKKKSVQRRTVTRPPNLATVDAPNQEG